MSNVPISIYKHGPVWLEEASYKDGFLSVGKKKHIRNALVDIKTPLLRKASRTCN